MKQLEGVNLFVMSPVLSRAVQVNRFSQNKYFFLFKFTSIYFLTIVNEFKF